MRHIAVVGLAYLVVAAMAATVAADELSDFDSARRAYDQQNYPRAARELESLVGGVVPRARNRVVRLEARKYLGATYLFLSRPKAARDQFELLLDEDPAYAIDPVAFPQAVVRTFNEVKAKADAERAKENARRARRQQERRSEELDDLLLQQRLIAELEALARTETVERVNSRWIAALPFGVGQFQNQDRRLGIMFAVMESAFLASSIATFIGHNSLRNEDPAPGDLARARRLERALRIGNWVSVGGLLSFYVAGLTEAQVRFKPTIRTTRERELPEELRDLGKERSQMWLEVGPTGARFRLDF